MIGVAVICCGGLGAVLRFIVGDLVSKVTRRRFPFGTMVVNLTGSFALGLLVGFGGSSGDLRLVVGTGLLGGFTTFSTHIVETLRLAIEEQRWVAATINLTLTAASCLIAGGVGLAIPRI